MHGLPVFRIKARALLRILRCGGGEGPQIARGAQSFRGEQAPACLIVLPCLTAGPPPGLRLPIEAREEGSRNKGGRAIPREQSKGPMARPSCRNKSMTDAFQ